MPFIKAHSSARSTIAVGRVDFSMDAILGMTSQEIDEQLAHAISWPKQSPAEGDAVFSGDSFFLTSTSDDIDARIEVSAKIHTHQRRQRSENFRQILVLIWLLIVSTFTVLALLMAGWVLLFEPEGANVERAKWLYETVLGGFVAGIIGFVAIKTFER